MRIYYLIWVDCITNLMVKEKDERNLKIKSMISMCMAMTANFFLPVAILHRYGQLKFYDINFNIPYPPLNNLANFFVLFFLPPIIINYLLIIHNNRFKILLIRYPYNNGKLFAGYFITSLLIPVVFMVIVYLYQNGGIQFFRDVPPIR
jgi:hypothetical protein